MKHSDIKKLHFYKIYTSLKVQSFKLNNTKYMIASWISMIASTQITNTELFAFIAILVFTLLTGNVLLINRKDNSNCYNVCFFSENRNFQG